MNKQMNMKIIKTKYDGFYVVNKNGKLFGYEGYNLCPKNVQKEIDKNNFKEIDCFYMEAIQFGYI